MEAIRKIVDSSLLDKIDLPPSFRNRKVELLISLPSKFKKNVNIDDVFGMFEKYKNTDLIPLEDEAWGMAVADKYDTH